MSETSGSLLDALRPPERHGLHDAVLVQLMAAIRSGQLKQGDRLLEVEIANRLGLSRGIVREAIRRLEQEGLVVSSPHRGSFVARLSPADVAEIYSVRCALEALAVELAMPRMTDEVLEDLTQIASAMVEAAERDDRGERVRLDLLFHERICLLSGHRYLHKLWSGLTLRRWLVYFDPARRPDPDLVGRSRAHFELIDLLRQRQIDAAIAWTRQHVLSRADAALESLSATDSPPQP